MGCFRPNSAVTARNGWGSPSNAGTEGKRLEGQEIALIFEKTSTRTRSAFEIGAYDQDAHVTYLDPSGLQLGHKESIAGFLTMGEASGKPYDAIAYAFTGDCRFNMGRSLLVMGALMRPAPHPVPGQRGPAAPVWQPGRQVHALPARIS